MNRFGQDWVEMLKPKVKKMSQLEDDFNAFLRGVVLAKVRLVKLRKLLAKASQVTKQDAKYVPNSESDEHCSQCTMFQKPNGCSLVKGMISSTGWCKYYERD